MPGIVGIVTNNPDRQVATGELRRMMRCMLHDASYSHGVYTVPDLGCYLGWVSHKGSFSDCNPLVDDTGDVVLIFSGEHFRHGADPMSLGGVGRDARCLLLSYLSKGEQFVDEINGWFAGVLVDRRRRVVLLLNDRFGVHRIYCHEEKDTFTFASEAKSIFSVRPATRALSTEGLGHFLGFGNVFDNRTLFEGVSLLPGGSSWEISDPSNIRKRRYFRPQTWAERPQLDAATFYTKLRDTLAEILPAYFRSTTPVGVSLTGGLDTRLVMAGLPADALPAAAYTYGGIYRECFDVDVARSVAKACGLSHETIALGDDFFTDFETFAKQTVWLTDGSLDICGSHEVYYSRAARQLAPIRLTGNYGSEVLRSVSTFKYNPPPSKLFDPVAIASTTAASSVFAAMRADHPVTFSAFQDIPWNLYGRLSAAQTELTLRSPYMDNALVAILYQAPPRTRETRETSLRLIADLKPELAAIVTDRGYGGYDSVPVARTRKLYRYLLFKAEWYYNAGTPDWAVQLNKVFPLKVFEPLFLGSHKIDHYRLWFQNQLKPLLQNILTGDRSRSRPYLDRRGYDDLIAAHQADSRNCLNEINKVVTLEFIQRVLLEHDYDRDPPLEVRDSRASGVQ
jgi:asparagine synthase (glutamine-hydrolysing)